MRSKRQIRAIINKIVSEDRDPLKDILDHDNTEDAAHALHDTWEGGEPSARWSTEDDQKAPERGNLVQPIDYAEVVGGEPTTKGPEVIQHHDGSVVSVDDRKLKMTESQLRSIVRGTLTRI